MVKSTGQGDTVYALFIGKEAVKYSRDRAEIFAYADNIKRKK